MQKISSFHLFIHPFLTNPSKSFFDQFLSYVYLYQHAKNQAISLICSEDMVDFCPAI